MDGYWKLYAMYSTLYNMQWQRRCNFVIKQPIQKKKCIDRVCINVMDHRIWDRMDRMSMNQLSQYLPWIFEFKFECIKFKMSHLQGFVLFCFVLFFKHDASSYFTFYLQQRGLLPIWSDQTVFIGVAMLSLLLLIAGTSKPSNNYKLVLIGTVKNTFQINLFFFNAACWPLL